MRKNRSLAKVARVRDENYPVGDLAPLFLRCHCGARPRLPPAPTNVIECYGCCGIKYDRQGWIIEGEVPV